MLCYHYFPKLSLLIMPLVICYNVEIMNEAVQSMRTSDMAKNKHPGEFANFRKEVAKARKQAAKQRAKLEKYLVKLADTLGTDAMCVLAIQQDGSLGHLGLQQPESTVGLIRNLGEAAKKLLELGIICSECFSIHDEDKVEKLATELRKESNKHLH